jgi:hypothetical protein
MATTPRHLLRRRGSGHHQLTGLGKPVRFTFDNVLYPASGNAHVDSIGILLYLTSPIGTSLAHVYYTGVTAENPAGYVVDAIDPNEPRASTSPVPEPSTLWLMGDWPGSDGWDGLS